MDKGKEQERKSPITEVVSHTSKIIPLSKAMVTKATAMNINVRAKLDIANSIQALADKAQAELNDYIAYCRDELGASAKKYDLQRMDVGFELKKEEKEK